MNKKTKRFIIKGLKTFLKGRAERNLSEDWDDFSEFFLCIYFDDYEPIWRAMLENILENMGLHLKTDTFSSVLFAMDNKGKKGTSSYKKSQ